MSVPFPVSVSDLDEKRAGSELESGGSLVDSPIRCCLGDDEKEMKTRKCWILNQDHVMTLRRSQLKRCLPLDSLKITEWMKLTRDVAEVSPAARVSRDFKL